MKHTVLFRNTTIERANYNEAFAHIFYLLGPGNYTLDGNYIKNFQ